MHNLKFIRQFYLEYPALMDRGEIGYALRSQSWLILCTDKNDAVVRYTLGQDQKKKIFASRYKLHLPTEAELKAEIRLELEVLRKGDDKA